MIDFKTAQVRRHQQNIQRYCRLLATELTDLERQYLHKRIAEEYAQLKHFSKQAFALSTNRCDRSGRSRSRCRAQWRRP
jgi:hypothetical protein